IKETVLTQNPLSPEQHAYTEIKSTVTALHKAVSLIEEEIETGEFAIGALLDVEGAFNNTPTEAICKAAENKGVPDMITNWIRDMLSHRLLEVTRGDTTVRGTVANGCPQGGVISPLEWNLVAEGALTCVKETGCHVIGYADDIMIVVRGRFLEPLADVLQAALDRLWNWCKT
ncbi:reverse transcriptase domain-containing protein, partial [Escherichia coli]|uniref:reverse transcriptase domain-containing protein n=1 Tax=Escherichia coli TaxID=562 RepID=UPI0029168B49